MPFDMCYTVKHNDNCVPVFNNHDMSQRKINTQVTKYILANTLGDTLLDTAEWSRLREQVGKIIIIRENYSLFDITANQPTLHIKSAKYKMLGITIIIFTRNF